MPSSRCVARARRHQVAESARIGHDALATIKARGMTRIDVTANPHALAFYEAVGFVVDGVAKTEFGVGTRMHLDANA
jgi:hypothetical protein